LTNYDAVATHVDTAVGELQNTAVLNTVFLVIFAHKTFWTLAGPNFFGAVKYRRLNGVLKQGYNVCYWLFEIMDSECQTNCVC